MVFYIGISLERELFQIAILKKEKRGVSIDSLHSIPQTLADVKELYKLTPFQIKNRSRLVASLPSEALLIRKFHLPFSGKRQVAKALPFQLESQLPSMTPSSVVCTQIRKEEGSKGSAVTAFVSTKEKIEEQLDRLKNFEVNPDQISCPQIALFRFARFAFPQETKIICLDVRGENVTCCVIEDQEILLSHTLSQESPFLLVEKLKIFLQQKGVSEERFSWLCTGDSLSKEIEDLLDQKKLSTPLAKEAVSIGLALDGASQDGMQIQFCQGTLLPSLVAKRRSLALAFYGGSLLLASLLVFLGGELCVSQKGKQISQIVHHYFPHQETSLKAESIESLLSQWEASLKGKKSPLNLVPTVPKVSEVLSYLSTHPSLLSEMGEAKEGVEIQSFSYRLTKYPKIGEMNLPYTAQVELKLKSQSQKVAKEFHEALMRTDLIVNHKKEVKWQQEGSLYYASFELSKKGTP